jgi:aspartyl-tRNA(Asn)/glutamyl-tRNA(Gln) amidotransferase subunit C
MVNRDDIKKLANLSRLALSDTELTALEGEFAGILAYIDTIRKVELPENPADSVYLDLENVMREDGEPHETGVFTEKLTAQFPRKDGDSLKVKKILG